jgi:hypothetical protein
MRFTVTFLGLFWVVGCGDSTRSLSPAAPSAGPASAFSVRSETTPAAETASGAGEASTDQTAVAANVSNMGLPSHEVEGNGRVTSVIPGTACPTLQFVVQGITVKTNPSTQYEDGTCEEIQVGVKLEIKGTRELDGSVLATRVEFEEKFVEGEGRVTSLVAGTACPTLQFKVQGITVKTDATTLFEGGTCADIQVGVKVEVKGLRQADGTVLARRIEFNDDEDDN